MVNKVFLQGRLTADPEISNTQSGTKVARFSLAVDRNFKSKDGSRKADFLRCEAWGGTAGTIERFFKKGSMIFVVGSVYQDTYTDKNDNRREKVWCNVAEVYFSDSKKVDGDDGGAPNTSPNRSYGGDGAAYPLPTTYGAGGAAPTNQFEDLGDDDGPLPF